jgi:hypothetical protein
MDKNPVYQVGQKILFNIINSKVMILNVAYRPLGYTRK